MAKGKVVDARVRSQVKRAWKDFEERNPKAAKALKVGADIFSGGKISMVEAKKQAIIAKKRKAKK